MDKASRRLADSQKETDEVSSGLRPEGFDGAEAVRMEMFQEIDGDEATEFHLLRQILKMSFF